MGNNKYSPLAPPAIWEDLVNDFLEMACFLTEAERRAVIEALKEDEVRSDAISAYPCFSIDGRVIVIRDDSQAIHTCWLYQPKEGKINKYRRTPTAEKLTT